MGKKDERIGIIKRIISEELVSSQDELIKHLKNHGIKATQSTLSRDFKTINVLKTPHPEKGYIYVLGDSIVNETVGGGTSNPYFSTDSASALRGIEIEADGFFKGTRVDGIYSADPEKDPTAVRFDEITFDEVYERNLKIMDMTAFTLCKENGLNIVVFDMDTEGNLKKVLDGEKIGTLVKQ